MERPPSALRPALGAGDIRSPADHGWCKASAATSSRRAGRARPRSDAGRGQSRRPPAPRGTAWGPAPESGREPLRARRVSARLIPPWARRHPRLAPRLGASGTFQEGEGRRLAVRAPGETLGSAGGVRTLADRTLYVAPGAGIGGHHILAE